MRSSLIYMLMAVGMLLCSCEKFTDVPAPPDAIPSGKVYSSNAKAEAAINGIYSYMMSGSASFSSWVTTIYAGASADELLRFNAGAVDAQIVNNDLLADNVWVGRIWTNAYRVIYMANNGIEGMTGSMLLSPDVRDRLLGECYFMRAFCSWHLVNIYGDVPMVLSTDWEANSVLPRTESKEVLKQIENDLLKAKEFLPAAYPTAARGRVNKWAATAMLARLYLYSGQWEQAVQASSEVLNSGRYTPLGALNKVFVAGSTEAIWQLVPDIGRGYIPELIDGGYYTTTVPKFYLRPQLMEVFEPGDQRRVAWIDSISYQGNRYYWPGKYKDITRKNVEYYVVLRAAEQYLLRAEARCMLNKLDEATQDLDVIRKRAGLPGYAGAKTQQEILQAIAKERRIELMAEWGHRWFDLKRTGKANEVLGALKPASWQPTDMLWPVPQAELNNNIALVQNPGY